MNDYKNCMQVDIKHFIVCRSLYFMFKLLKLTTYLLKKL